MKKAHYFLAILFVTLSSSAVSQNRLYADKNVKKLKVTSTANEGHIYIKSKFLESGDIGVFLINRSSEDIEIFIGHARHIEFHKEAKTRNGKWKEIDQKLPQYLICGTGARHIKLTPNHYTWQKIYKKQYQGEYETDMRFSYQLSDSTVIVSKPIKVSINPDLFLPFYERAIKYLDILALSDTLSKNYRIRLAQRKLQLYHKYKPIEETIALSEVFVSQYPESIKAKYGLSTHYIRYISQNRKALKKAEIQVLLSKAIGLLEQITADNSNFYKRAQERRKGYAKLLLSKKDWIALKENKYEKINHEYYASLPNSSKEKVKIKFKN